MSDASDTRAGSVIRDHPFRPRVEAIEMVIVDFNGDPAGRFTLPPNPHLCRHCRLAEAAHFDTTVTERAA